MVAKSFNSAGCPTTRGGSIGLNDKKPYFVATSLMAQMPGFIISVVVIIALFWQNNAAQTEESRPPIIPGFVLGFLCLAALNSFGLIPGSIAALLAKASSWALLAAIAAVGMKTDMRRIVEVGGGPIALIVLETLFLALLVLAGISFWELGP